jgi:hypothetical protein
MIGEIIATDDILAIEALGLNDKVHLLHLEREIPFLDDPFEFTQQNLHEVFDVLAYVCLTNIHFRECSL